MSSYIISLIIRENSRINAESDKNIENKNDYRFVDRTKINSK